MLNFLCNIEIVIKVKSILFCILNMLPAAMAMD